MTWNKLKKGDFFFYDLGNDLGIHLYQKIKPISDYNCVHINSGDLCKVYEANNENYFYEKVTVNFDVKFDEDEKKL